jgi:hypothetical protein
MAGKPVRSRAGLFSRASAVRNVDGRTREARIIRETTAALVEHLGRQPRVPQQLLIHASAVLVETAGRYTLPAAEAEQG